tara:strand:+ start:2128 stop:2721 length:594 start_codon:yes stop_codon:yes gene_type:complete
MAKKKLVITIKKGPSFPPPEPEPTPLSSEEKKPQAEVSLKMRKTLDGNYVVSDHTDIEIVISPNQNKVIAFAKDNYDDFVYEIQDKLFKFLTKKGIIDPNTVQGGNVFMSMEGTILTPEDEAHNAIQLTILNVGRFIEKEKPKYLLRKAYEEEDERKLTEPGPKDSTEFDPERLHKAQKGAHRPIMRPYGISSIYRV